LGKGFIQELMGMCTLANEEITGSFGMERWLGQIYEGRLKSEMSNEKGTRDGRVYTGPSGARYDGQRERQQTQTRHSEMG
jgi:hypothetical protein